MGTDLFGYLENIYFFRKFDKVSLYFIPMPRHARQRSVTHVYHVILRGINRMMIFCENDDWQFFLHLLKQQASEKFRIYCYCLMTNHIHLIVESEELSRGVHRIATRYAMWFNHKYKRCGYLFQDRFKSEVIEDEIYLLQCFRYILQNPVKAGICTKASLYSWSSYCNYFSSYSSFIYTEFLNTFFKKEKDFENYISIVDEGQYMDIDQLKKWNNQEIKDICNQKLGNKGIMELSQEDRILLIQELRQKTHASIRQLSEVTGISRYNVRYWKK